MSRMTTAILAAILLIIGTPVHADPLTIQRGTIKTSPFHLQSGEVMPEVVVAYETYGRLAPNGRNAILIAPGFTTSHRVAGRQDSEPSWDKLIGSGKAIDTDKHFVVSVAHLGSSFGSTNPADLNPATAKPYGPDFPQVRAIDLVNAQKAVLEGLGVKHLVAVIAQSYGGRHVFLWGVTFPTFMDGLVAIETSPKDPRGQEGVDQLLKQLSRDPNWNGGSYYDKGGILTVLTEMRVATLKGYGIDQKLADRFPDPAERQSEIIRLSREWAAKMDGNSLVVLRRANVGFDTEPHFDKIIAPVLYVLTKSDRSFPPSIASGVMAKLQAAGVRADYLEVDSNLGHGGAIVDGDKWAPRLQAFLRQLQPGK